jgi:hypothetical protein
MTTMTAPGPGLVADLRQLLDDAGDVDTDEAARALADKVTAILRRARGRLARAARKATPAGTKPRPPVSSTSGSAVKPASSNALPTTAAKPAAAAPSTALVVRRPVAVTTPARPVSSPVRPGAVSVLLVEQPGRPSGRRRRNLWARALALVLVLVVTLPLLLLPQAGLRQGLRNAPRATADVRAYAQFREEP